MRKGGRNGVINGVQWEWACDMVIILNTRVWMESMREYDVWKENTKCLWT